MRKRSIALSIATVLSTAYTAYLFIYFIGGFASASGANAVGVAIAAGLVTPHAILFLIGVVFGWIGLLAKKPWAALVAAILYSVGTFLFLAWALWERVLLPLWAPCSPCSLC